jgi:prolyl-tRNA synthetase
MRGVPLRLEIGPKDVEKEMVALSRRDKPRREGKSFVPQADIASTVIRLLDEIQEAMLVQATVFRDPNIHDPKNYDELKSAVADGWAFSWLCESKQCEAKVKKDTKATTRIIPLDQPEGLGACVVCGRPAKKKVYFAKAY